MAAIPSPRAGNSPRYPAGQRLFCEKCGSEIEIISPCTCNPPDQVLRCCAQDMKPSTGRDVHVSAE
jgi:hypothetical protein